MIVSTWNINGLRARFDFFVHWLRARKPDLVGLQELKLSEDQFPFEEIQKEGYQAIVHGQKAWNGVAILSRTPVELKLKGLSGQEELGARLIAGQTEDLTYVTVYCPNGKSLHHPDFERKLRWFDALAEFLEGSLRPDEPALLGGDFNICPAGLDSWNEEQLSGSIFHTAGERQRLDRLFRWGWFDLFRRLHPDERQYSWWDYRGGAFYRNQGLRIDLMLGTRPVECRLRQAEIDRDYRKKKEGMTASDHAPVTVELTRTAG